MRLLFLPSSSCLLPEYMLCPEPSQPLQALLPSSGASSITIIILGLGIGDGLAIKGNPSAVGAIETDGRAVATLSTPGSLAGLAGQVAGTYEDELTGSTVLAT